MSKRSEARRSQAFRPGNIGVDHLEVRKLLTVDYSLMIMPNVNAIDDFDPEDYDSVNLTTYEANLEGFTPEAYAPPGEIAGSDSETRIALIADLENRKKADIDSIDVQITKLELEFIKLGKGRAKLQSMYDFAHEKFSETDGIPFEDRTPQQILDHSEYGDQLDTLYTALEDTDEKLEQIQTQINLYDLYKGFISATYDYMEDNIQEVNMAADPTVPPVYVYHVDNCSLIMT